MFRIARAAVRRLGLRSHDEATLPAEEVFDGWARDGRARKMEEAHGPVVRRILESLQLEAGSRYLDLGCGNGYTVRWAASKRGATGVGLDVSAEMLALAQARSQEVPNASFVRAALPHPPLAEESFDVIFSMEVMYYMTDLDEALREVLALLKPGGLFVSAIDYYRENPQCGGWSGWVGTEMKLMSERQWRRAFRRAGFRSVTQWRVVVPKAEAREPWHATVGSLATSGTRA